jgi:hypothetical protein
LSLFLSRSDSYAGFDDETTLFGWTFLIYFQLLNLTRVGVLASALAAVSSSSCCFDNSSCLFCSSISCAFWASASAFSLASKRSVSSFLSSIDCFVLGSNTLSFQSGTVKPNKTKETINEGIPLIGTFFLAVQT